MSMNTLQRNTTVLVIEDNPFDAEILVSIIECHGGTAVHTESKDIADRLLSNFKFDLVTVDLQLSEGHSGLDLVRDLGLVNNENSTGPSVVVISSKQFEPEAITKLQAEGFRDVLVKPLDQGYLVNVLNAVNPRKAPVRLS